MGLFTHWRAWNFPLIGKSILLIMVLLQLSVNIYLLSTNLDFQDAALISEFLIATSCIMLLSTILAIPDRFYFNYPKSFHVVGLLSIGSRLAAIFMIVRLNNQVSDQIYMTQEGYLGLFRTSIIFIIMQVVLIYEKCAFYRTKQQVEQIQLRRLIKV